MNLQWLLDPEPKPKLWYLVEVFLTLILKVSTEMSSPIKFERYYIRGTVAFLRSSYVESHSSV